MIHRLALSLVYYPLIYNTLKPIYMERGIIWILIYITAVCLSLIPAQLLEFRYFTPGIIVLIVNHPFYFETDDLSEKLSDRKPSEIDINTSIQSYNSGSDGHRDKVKVGRIHIVDGIYLTAFILLMINAGLFYIFVHRPFIWADGSTARFML